MVVVVLARLKRCSLWMSLMAALTAAHPVHSYSQIALMVLDHYMYTGNVTALQRYLPIAVSAADFFRQHYNNRTSDGKYVIWPTQVMEQYWCYGWDTVNNRPPANCCVNDLPTIAGLHTLLSKLLQLPTQFTTAQQRAQWTEFQSALPPLPVNATTGALVPADVLSTGGGHNVEFPEGYASHPYRLYTVGRNLSTSANPVDLTPALLAFKADPLSTANQGEHGVTNCSVLPQAAATTSRCICGPLRLTARLSIRHACVMMQAGSRAPWTLPCWA